MTDNVTNEELIEAIKRPDRYYRITCGGYGGESVYAKISKEAKRKKGRADPKQRAKPAAKRWNVSIIPKFIAFPTFR